MTQEIRWQHGNHSLQTQLATVLVDPERAVGQVEVLFERPGRRRLLRLTIDNGDSIFVKQIFRRGLLPTRRELLPTRRGLLPTREGLSPTSQRWSPFRLAEAATGLDAAAREWRALSKLHRMAVSVPEPVALGTLSNGDRIVATRFVEGVTLKARLEASGHTTRNERNAILSAIGRLVHRFHNAGYIHRDLHWGNILITNSGPVLLDLQSALPAGIAFLRRRDLGDLDYSVSPCLTSSDRMRLRKAALGIEGPLGRAERAAVRAVGKASQAAGRAHAASRTRRSLRPGRQYATIHFGLSRGLRRREVSEREVAIALAARDASAGDESCEILKSDPRSQVTAVSAGDRSWIVKDYRAGGWPKRIADLFRGSPARRAWLGGHGLLARGIGTALPVAFIEQRHFGIPIASATVLEDLRHLQTADACTTDWASEREILSAVSRLAIALHRRGAIHGDLKASHVLLERTEGGVNGRLIDLEGVHFRRRLSDRTRILALAQLNASLPDHISNTERLRAFQRYAAAVPFLGDAVQCLREVVRVSIARQHRWTGENCSLANNVRSPNGNR